MATPQSSSGISRRAVALAAAAVVGASALMPFSASAQQAFTRTQCNQATAVADALTTKYNGKISSEFANSIRTFVVRNCDMSTDFRMMPGTADKDAFGEFRTKLIVIKTSAAGRPATLAKN
jgi:hypothetical protein